MPLISFATGKKWRRSFYDQPSSLPPIFPYRRGFVLAGKASQALSCLKWFKTKQTKPYNLKRQEKPNSWIGTNLPFPRLTCVIWALWRFCWFDKPQRWFPPRWGSSGTSAGHCPLCSPFLERSQHDPPTVSFADQGCHFSHLSAPFHFCRRLAYSSPLRT